MRDRYLIVRPKYGLCNQLFSISKGIIFGLISDRDVIFSSFQLDYKNENNTCDFHDVIDIIHLQALLNSFNINIKIYSDKSKIGKKAMAPREDNISYIKDFIPILFNENNVNEEYLDIDNPISSIIPDEYHKLLNEIDLKIKFTDKYIDIANNIKNKLNLTNYIAVHLRLEDDAIVYMKTLGMNVDGYIQKYISNLNSFKNMKHCKVYICTSLNMNENIYNNFYKNIKERYNLIDKSNIFDGIDDLNINECREVFGIIDFLIAKGSVYFVGIDWSSFSLYLYNIHRDNGKRCTLL